MFICGNLFNFSTITSRKKIKNLYILYTFFKKKNTQQFLTVNKIIKSKTSFDIIGLFLFVFYFNKTKNINRLNLSNKQLHFFLNKKKDFIVNQFNYLKILLKYSKLGIINNYKKYLFLQNRTVVVNVNNNSSFLPKNTTSSIYKNIGIFDFVSAEFQFLRKNKVYNKGRYSRCRQNYRTGVYLCMYLSIASIFGLYYWFFKFSFNFSYLWWFFIGFFGSFLFPKIVKYRLYEPSTLLSTFYGFFTWVSLLLKSLKG